MSHSKFKPIRKPVAARPVADVINTATGEIRSLTENQFSAWLSELGFEEDEKLDLRRLLLFKRACYIDDTYLVQWYGL